MSGTSTVSDLTLAIRKRACSSGWCWRRPPRSAPGILAGTFEPHRGSTFVGETVATNTLIGGDGKVALLPLNLQPNTNVNDAAGVAKLTLKHQP